MIDRFNFFRFGGIYHVCRMVNDPFQGNSFVKQRTGFTAISIKKRITRKARLRDQGKVSDRQNYFPIIFPRSIGLHRLEKDAITIIDESISCLVFLYKIIFFRKERFTQINLHPLRFLIIFLNYRQ